MDIQALSIRYKGATAPALDKLSLSISRGRYFGLLGPNGAGKTTLISFLCGQIEGQYSRAQILGFNRDQIQLYKPRLGYAPQELALYPTLSPRENLSFFSKILGLSQNEVSRSLEWVGLEDQADRPTSELSGGMKRRLNLGVALLSRPQLLILDEPTVGIDPQSRNFIFERILELKSEGVTLIYSTHYLEEVQKLCDDVGILQNGKMTAYGTLRDVLGEGNLETKFLDLTGRFAQ